MLSFKDAISALELNRRIRRSNWDAGTYMEADGDHFLVICRGIESSALTYDLSWHEIKANNWEILP